MDESFQIAIVLGPIIGGAILIIGIITAWQRHGDKREAKGKWKGEVDADRKSFNEFMDEVRKKLDKIFERLPQPSPTVGASPVKLTAYGERLSQSVRAHEWTTRLAQHLIVDTRGKAEYEIYDMCEDFINIHYKNNFTEEEKNRIKSAAYENAGNSEQVLNVLTVELRDRLLEIHGMKKT
ncbi:MAG: hypothetical protein OXC41_01815 [Gammaproteobacteria bacterium]|nr:hypothetical protein [Gammaproteobacteria bacterium]